MHRRRLARYDHYATVLRDLDASHVEFAFLDGPDRHLQVTYAISRKGLRTDPPKPKPLICCRASPFSGEWIVESAAIVGPENLRKPEIAAAIERARATRSEGTELDRAAHSASVEGSDWRSRKKSRQLAGT